MLPISGDIKSSGRKVNAADSDTETVLDLLALKECIERADDIRAHGGRLVLAVPVHFSTLSRLKSWEQYAAAYRRVPAAVLRDIAFVVRGIEPGVPHIRLAQELPKIALGSHRVLCVLRKCDSGAGHRFAGSSAYGLGLDFDVHTGDEGADQLISRLVKEAKIAATESFVLGVSSTSHVLQAIEAGIRFLEGEAIRPTVRDPRHGFAHNVEDLYRSKFTARLP